MHIEQGTTLEHAGNQIGVVTGIVAIWQYRIIIEGQQDHAGGTTMAERRDAGLAAVRLLSRREEELPKHCGERTVWTTGRIDPSPGAASIIPGRAKFLFQFRDVSIDVLECLDGVLTRGSPGVQPPGALQAVLKVVSRSHHALCDPALLEAFASAARALAPDGWQYMPSGAGHDAQYMALVVPSAMIFVPSIGGVSHHWTEDTKREDLAMGLGVLTEGAWLVLAAYRS